MAAAENYSKCEGTLLVKTESRTDKEKDGVHTVDITIKKLSQDEKIKSRPLYETCFKEDSEAFVDYYYEEVAKDNEIYVVEEEGEPLAMLHLNPYDIVLNGEVNFLNYIVAVATKPGERRRGYMKALLKEALKDMYESGKPFTYLMPAKEEIYLPFDFRTVYQQNVPKISQDENLSAEGYEELTTELCGEVASRGESYLRDNFQVYTLRDEEYYKKKLKQYHADDGKIYIKREGENITGLAYYYPENTEEDQVNPLIMIRIVDVKRMLMSMKLKTLTAACFTVVDPLIPKNNCCLTITGTEFSGVLLMDGLEKNSEGTLNVGALAELLFGVKSVEELCNQEQENVKMTKRLQGELEKIIPLNNICINELV